MAQIKTFAGRIGVMLAVAAEIACEQEPEKNLPPVVPKVPSLGPGGERPSPADESAPVRRTRTTAPTAAGADREETTRYEAQDESPREAPAVQPSPAAQSPAPAAPEPEEKKLADPPKAPQPAPANEAAPSEPAAPKKAAPGALDVTKRAAPKVGEKRAGGAESKKGVGKLKLPAQ